MRTYNKTDSQVLEKKANIDNIDLRWRNLIETKNFKNDEEKDKALKVLKKKIIQPRTNVLSQVNFE